MSYRSSPPKILFQILRNIRIKSLASILGTCRDLRSIGSREIQSRLSPIIARDDLFFNVSLDTPQYKNFSPYMSLRSSGLRVLGSTGQDLYSSGTGGLHSQYLCLDLDSHLYKDPGICSLDRGLPTSRLDPHRTYPLGIAESLPREFEREIILEDFESFGQICIDLNIVIQRPASGLRRALAFHKGFIRIARSKLDTQITRRASVGDSPSSTHQAAQDFWVGLEPKVGLNIIVNRQEVVQPFPKRNARHGYETGALRKFSLQIQGQFNGILEHFRTDSSRAPYSHASTPQGRG